MVSLSASEEKEKKDAIMMTLKSASIANEQRRKTDPKNSGKKKREIFSSYASRFFPLEINE